MVDIRQVAWMRFKWWDPLSWRQTWRFVRYRGTLADWMHNLGMFASIDFERFDEDWFWRELTSLEKRFAEFKPGLYRDVFDRRLGEMNSKSP